ncbi:MAG TPA: peptidoglycan DD-metalloendopeptidase family protein, partial [Acidimicrobiales bacterium]
PVSGALTHSQGSVAGKAFYLKGDDGNTYYGAHLHTLDGKPGRVERGTRIGTVGSTGNAEGTTPHLHFEIHLGRTEAVDPLPTITRWCK